MRSNQKRTSSGIAAVIGAIVRSQSNLSRTCPATWSGRGPRAQVRERLLWLRTGSPDSALDAEDGVQLAGVLGERRTPERERGARGVEGVLAALGELAESGLSEDAFDA